MPKTFTEADLDRLNAFVEKGDAGADGCWKWTGPGNDNSGPVLTAGGDRFQVRRVMYELRCAPVPKTGKWFVLPTCRNKLCVNPAHLTLSGTPKLPVPTHAQVPHTSPALGAAVLSALDTLTMLDAPAIKRQIAACEARLTTLRALFLIATVDRAPIGAPPYHAAHAAAPAPPHGPAVPAVQEPAPQKPATKRPVKKPAAGQPKPGPLARRLVYLLASEGAKTLPELVTATGATAGGVGQTLRGETFAAIGAAEGCSEGQACRRWQQAVRTLKAAHPDIEAELRN